MRPRRRNQAVVRVVDTERSDETGEHASWADGLARRAVNRHREHVVVRRMVLGDKEQRALGPGHDGLRQVVVNR